MTTRKFLHTLLVIQCALFIQGGAQASADAVEQLVDLEPRSFYIPNGFDDNDEVVVVMDGYLPDTCHRLRPAVVRLDAVSRKIVVQPRAVLLPGHCSDVTVPYSTVARIGILPEGKYAVSTPEGKLEENLLVNKASTSAADDFLYAPIDSATVQVHSGGKLRGSLMGRFTDSCLRLDKITVINSGKTLEVLPIIRKFDKDENGNACVKQEKPFQFLFDLPELAPGRYLLHVRSLNGQSVNEVFSNHWFG